MNVQPRKTPTTINIRAKYQQRHLIDLAAESLGRTRSEFMLDAACREAESVLLDQAFFSVSPETFAQLQALIEKPLPPTDELRRLLNTKSPWDDE